MSKVINWVEKSNKDIIAYVIRALEQNEEASTVYNRVKSMELSESEITQMVASDIGEVIEKWNKYYEYGYVPISEPRYAETSNLMKSRTSVVSAQLAINATNSFANLTSQMFNLVESGNMSRKQAISVLRKKYHGNTIMYSNGRAVPINEYLNMVFRTELANVTRERARDVGDSLGTSVYEMSSRVDSAERCVYAQGNYINFALGDQTVQFMTSSGMRSFQVRDVVLHDRYGQADALGGIGCRHTWVPRIVGISRSNLKIQNADYFTGL